MMGAKGIILLVLFFFNFVYPASLHPLCQTLAMVHLQANTENNGEQEHLKNSRSGGNNTPCHGRKLQHAFGSRGVTGGQAGGAGADGNGGGSHSNYPQGGAVIPVYAAGAANGHHNNHHHGAGSYIHLSVGPPIFAVLLAYLQLRNPFGF